MKRSCCDCVAALYILEMIKIKQINRGDVYMIEVENARDSEQSGLRPAVIIQNDIGNLHSPTTIVALVTSRKKHSLPTHVQLHCRRLTINSTALLEQIRTVSVKRLGNYVCTLGNRDMKQINQAIRISLGCGKG